MLWPWDDAKSNFVSNTENGATADAAAVADASVPPRWSAAWGRSGSASVELDEQQLPIASTAAVVLQPQTVRR